MIKKKKKSSVIIPMSKKHLLLLTGLIMAFSLIRTVHPVSAQTKKAGKDKEQFSYFLLPAGRGCLILIFHHALSSFTAHFL